MADFCRSRSWSPLLAAAGEFDEIQVTGIFQVAVTIKAGASGSIEATGASGIERK